MLGQFTHKYSVSKTLRFALLPQGKTLDYIKKQGLLEQDAQRASDYARAKIIIDRFHKDFIESVLETLILPIDLLNEFETIYLKDNLSKTDKDKKRFVDIQNTLRKNISDAFTKNTKYKRLLGKELIQNDIIAWLKAELISARENKAEDPILLDLDKDIRIISSFNKFTTYFSGFNDNRENIYSKEAHSTSIGYRIIHENLPKFIQNKKNYNFLQKNIDKYPEIINHLQNADVFKKIDKQNDTYNNNQLEHINPESIFDLSYFNSTLTQVGIDQYNHAIGGMSLQDSTKIKGMNEVINLYRQKLNQELKKGEKPVRISGFNMLYKQILSDRVHLSFRLEAIENDQNLIDQIINFYRHYLGARPDDQTADSVHQFHDLLSRFPKILEDLNQADIKKIWIRNDTSLSNISQKIFDSYHIISDALTYFYENTNADFINAKEKAESKKPAENIPKKIIDAKNKWLKSGYINLDTLNKALNHFKENLDISVDEKKRLYDLITDDVLINYFSNPIIRIQQNDSTEKNQYLPLWTYVETCYQDIKSILEVNTDSLNTLRQDKEKVAEIKKFLDSVQEILWHIQPLNIKEVKNIEGKIQTETYEQDSFYGQFTPAYDALTAITSLYNQVRNYLTKKPYSIEKYKLNFENAELLNGWDANKEEANTSLILRKKALRNPSKKDNTVEEYYEYYLAIMSKKNNKSFRNPTLAQADEAHYEKMHYKLLPGANKMLPKVFFSTKGLATFKPNEHILDIYKNERFKKGDTFSLSALHALIDFYKYSISIHQDWKEFKHQFSSTNTFEDISGFYREVEHQGYKINFDQKISLSYIDNLINEGKLYLFKIYNKDFSPASTGNKNLHTLYWEALFDEQNLSNVIYMLNGDAEVFYRKASLKPEITHKKNMPIPHKKDNHNGNENSIFPYDLIKNKRFTQDSFQFHTPITLNFKATGSENINEDVFNYIRDQNLNKIPMNVIGLDRGERHLIYLSVIDPNRKILHQQTLNEYNQTDYQKNLHIAEDERDKARKAWLNIENIKELKAGYLSMVVHDIATLMLKYNAIIAMEDLNFGFKRGRIKIEKQVYQKFEKALIDKLSYLVFKNPNSNQPGLMNALQLTSKFKSFQKLGKQSGFIFYVPAAYTSKIDPTTGFVNFLDTRYYSIDKSKYFFNQFEFIRFNPNNKYFEFKLNYSKFTDRAATTREDWTLCSHTKTRYIYNKTNQKHEIFDVTHSLIKLFEKYDINHHLPDLKQSIQDVNNAQFFQTLLYALNVLLMMRYDGGQDSDERDRNYILSPVKNNQGEFYDSRVYYDQGRAAIAPIDADANGAYNIALKGLMMLETIQTSKDKDSSKSMKLAMTNKEWLAYTQKYNE